MGTLLQSQDLRKRANSCLHMIGLQGGRGSHALCYHNLCYALLPSTHSKAAAFGVCRRPVQYITSTKNNGQWTCYTHNSSCLGQIKWSCRVAQTLQHQSAGFECIVPAQPAWPANPAWLLPAVPTCAMGQPPLQQQGTWAGSRRG